ncbi:MAG: Ig-like domain-containing protein [Actinomycetota bacterium]|nr:Ig-like domain-containing protein [Actinomycetota bacterium]
MPRRLAAPSTLPSFRVLAMCAAFVLALLALAAPASAAVTQKQAAKKALAALGTEKRTDAVIVFGLPSRVRAGTAIQQAGTNKPTTGSTRGLNSKLRQAGVRTVRPPVVLRGFSDERFYFFYEDRGPFMLYQHPGRVAIVGADSGRVKVSKTILWPPMVNGRLPAFLKSAKAYRSSKYQVLNRPWTVPGQVKLPRTPPRVNRNVFDLDPFGPGRPLPSLGNSKSIAGRLAAERSCVLRVTDTLPTFWNVNELNLTRSYVGTLFEQLERDDAGFIDDRYGARTGESLDEAVDRLIGKGCKDILLYIAGQGYDSGGEPVIHLGTSVRGGLIAQQNISAGDLREIVADRAGTTFKFKIDAPYAAGMIGRLRDLPNVLLIETPANGGQGAFAFVPQIEAGGEMVNQNQNPAGLLEFTNCELVGLKAFFESAAEIDKVVQAQNEGVSFLVEMLARSHELCAAQGAGFWDELGLQPQLYTAKRGSGNPTNRPPSADKQDVTVNEDTPKSITLGASDPDGDPLTYTITKQPDHGDLTGSGPNRTYTPDPDYTGKDDFSFKVTDDNGAESNTAKVDITVVEGNDPPVLTTSAGSSGPYAENAAAAVDIDTGLTVSDPDDTNLEGATVQITNLQAGDKLDFTDQLGITGTYDSGTGILTLTGSATVSDYQTALRDVGYHNPTNHDPDATKTFEFKVSDGDLQSTAATKSMTVTKDNDAPTVTTTASTLNYNEGDGQQKVDDQVAVADPDSQLQSAEVKISANHHQAEDDLVLPAQPGLTINYNDGTGTLTITGTASVATYQTALRDVRYVNNSENPSGDIREVSFKVQDTTSLDSTPATRDVDVVPVNDNPVANDDSGTATEDDPALAVPVLSNDTDAEGDAITISGATDPANGTVVLTGGSPGAHTGLTYQPDPDYCNNPPSPPADTFTYTVNGGDTATVSMTVTCTPDNPVANDDSRTVNEDSGATSFTVLSNDTDADGDAIDITNVTDPANGTATVVDGSPDQISYTPDANYCNNPPGGAPDTFTYTVNGGDTATVSVTVDCVNDAPVANDDTATVNEDSSNNSITVIANDTDVESDAIEITNVSDPANGTATIVQGSPDTIEYTPDANYCNNPPGGAPDTFTYTVNGGDTATVSVTVNCSDDNPVANDDTATVNEDSANNSIAVVANDTDVESDQVEITNVSDPANGTTTIVQGNPDTIEYTPDPNYCNNPPGTTPDTFTYTVNGGDTATVSVTVTCVDDAHVANDDTKTVNEDSSGTGNDIDVTANDTDVENDQVEVTNVSDPANGTATIVQGNPDKVNYVPDANYCNNPPGTTLETFTYTVAGGDTATVTVTVDCDDDNPVAVDDAATVGEDSGANEIDVLANDTDVDGGAKTVQAKTDGSKGTVQITMAGAKVEYTPNANECGADSFEYTLNGGSTGTVNVTITCVNDAPVVDLNGEANPGINTTATFTETLIPGSGDVTLAPNADTSDVDDTNLESATITLTNRPDGLAESLSVDTTGTTIVSSGYDSGTGVLTLTGSASKQDYETVLRTVSYDNTAAPPTPTNRTVEFKVNDGDVDSTVATATVTVVPLNLPPAVDLNGTDEGGQNETATFTENGSAVNITDSDADLSDADDTDLVSMTVTLTNRPDGAAESLSADVTGTSVVNGGYNSGTGVLTLSGTAPLTEYETVLRTVKYNNTSNTPDTTDRVVEFKVNDGQDDSNTATSNVGVVAVNDPPVNTVPGGQTLDEDSSKTFSSGNSNQISVADADAGTNPLKVTLSVTNGTLTLNGTTGLSFACGTCAGDGTSDQTMTFTGSQADINAALNGLIYVPNSNFNGADTLTITTDDQGNTGSGGAQSDTDNVGLTVTAVNDGPTNTVPGAQQVDEDEALTLSSGNGNALSTADPDSGASDVRATLDVDNGTITLATIAGLNFACVGCQGDGAGDATMVFEGTVAEINAALDGMAYQGTLNYNGPDTLTFTVNDLGNSGTGGALQDQDTVAITVNPVNDAPSTDSETFGGAGSLNDQAHGNTTYQVDDPSDDKSAPTNPHTEITGDILDGDADVDGPGPLIVQSAGSDAGATNGQTADGGTVTVESDGDFVYQPPATVSCDNGTDSFNYKISDQANSGGGPIPGTAIGTVTIHLEGCVWYVHNNAAGNAGTATQPYDTLAQAETASGANHTVFVFNGDNTDLNYATGFAMNSGERLIGEHEGLTVDQDQGGSMTADSLHPANPGAHPTLSALNEDVVDLDDGNEVRGFELNPGGNGSGIAGASGDTGGATIDDVNILDSGVAGIQPGLELDSTTGTFNISNIVVNNSGAASPPNTATGVRLNNAGTVNFNPTGQTSITTSGAKGLDAIGTNMGSGSTFDDITVSGSSAGGVNLLNTTGTTTFGDGTGTDLSLTTTSGSAGAFVVSNGGTVSVAAAGADDVHATGGPAIDVVGTSGPTLAFDDVDSTNSANDGINLDGLGTGTFSGTSGDIAGASGISFDLNGGSGAITYPGNFGNGSGTTAFDITGRTGGVVSLSGPVSDTNDAGGQLNLAGNSGGSTVFSAATKQFNTGATDAVNFLSSNGHTFVLSGGGTDIDTTTGSGLTASDAGTIEVSGSGNTLDKTGAGNRGLNISDTDIAAADVTFQRIRTDGALTGIRLNNTGSLGNLAVTGGGGTCTNADQSGCSGGEIENGTGADSSSATPDGTGIVLNATDAPSLTRMWIHGHSNYGIRGTDVDGFTLANSVINGTNGTNSAGGFDDSSVYFDNNSGPALTGSASVTNTHVEGGFTNNFWVSQTSGVLNRLTMDALTVGHNSTSNGNQGLMVEGLGTSTTNVTLQNSTLTGSRGMVSQFIGNGTGGGDLDIHNTDFSNNHAGEDSASGLLGINGGAGSGGTFNVNVSSGGLGANNFQSASGHAVNIIKSNGSGSLTGAFDGNAIGVDDPSDNSGSLNGSGLRFQHAGGGGTATMNITNNTIREYNNDGITMQASAGGVADTGTFNANVTGNTVTDPGSNPLAIGFNGIRMTAGVIAGDAFTTCVHIKSNSVVGSNTDPVDNPGQPDIFTWVRMNSTMRLPGYAGGATDGTAVGNFLRNQNDANPNSAGLEAPAPTAQGLASNSGTFSGTGTGCP